MSKITYTKEEILANREVWVKALKSGKYTPGKDALWTVDKDTGNKCHCCLGVAMELFDSDSNLLEVSTDLSMSKGLVASDKVIAALGLKSEIGANTYSSAMSKDTLAHINDNTVIGGYMDVLLALDTNNFWTTGRMLDNGYIK